MKKILSTSFIIIIIFSIGIPLNIDAQTYRTHSVIVSSNVSSLDIPLVGTLTILMQYSIDFEVRTPSIIEAGTTEKITISPRNGVLTTSFFLDGNVITTIPKNLPLGSSTTFDIPGALGVGEVYGSPSLVVGLGVKGPANPSDYIRLNSMSSIDFPLRVNNEIGNSNSVTVFFPMRVDLDIGGNIDLFLTNIPIHATTVPIQVSSEISETIPLRKYFTTSTSLQIKDDSRIGYIQVYPSVTTSSGQSVSSSNISIYVDGEYKKKVSAKNWSTEIHTGSGQHNIEAKFPETKSSSNNAIIYKSSSVFQSFNVKSPTPKSTSTQQGASQGSDRVLTCGSGTYEENGKCVPDPLFGGGCLIATAAFDSELSPQVQQLREIRDNVVLQTKSGSAFMTGFNGFYYSFSPTIADWERQNQVFKETVRIVITPMLYSLSLLEMVDIDSEEEMLGYGIGIIGLNIGMYFLVPTILIARLRKNNSL